MPGCRGGSRARRSIAGRGRVGAERRGFRGGGQVRAACAAPPWSLLWAAHPPQGEHGDDEAARGYGRPHPAVLCRVLGLSLRQQGARGGLPSTVAETFRPAGPRTAPAPSRRISPMISSPVRLNPARCGRVIAVSPSLPAQAGPSHAPARAGSSLASRSSTTRLHALAAGRPGRAQPGGGPHLDHVAPDPDPGALDAPRRSAASQPSERRRLRRRHADHERVVPGSQGDGPVVRPGITAMRTSREAGETRTAAATSRRARVVPVHRALQRAGEGSLCGIFPQRAAKRGRCRPDAARDPRPADRAPAATSTPGSLRPRPEFPGGGLGGEGPGKRTRAAGPRAGRGRSPSGASTAVFFCPARRCRSPFASRAAGPATSMSTWRTSMPVRVVTRSHGRACAPREFRLRHRRPGKPREQAQLDHRQVAVDPRGGPGQAPAAGLAADRKPDQLPGGPRRSCPDLRRRAPGGDLGHPPGSAIGGAAPLPGPGQRALAGAAHRSRTAHCGLRSRVDEQACSGQVPRSAPAR